MDGGLVLRRVLVVGLGRSGLAAARLAARLGAAVFATDDRAPSASGDSVPGFTFLDPEQAVAAMDSFDAVVPSPGVPVTHTVLGAALRAGVRLLPEIELAEPHLSGTLLAVTGTNGKSTVVSLLGAILEAAGRRVFAGGNLGRPLSDAVGEDLEFVVAEVSSFQLEHATTFHPHVAALLNVTPDHLDRHGDLAAYEATKMRLFARMTPDDFAVFPCGDAWTAKARRATAARVSTFGWLSEAAGPDAPGLRIDAARRRLVDVDAPARFVVRLPQRGWPELPHDLENAAAAAEIARLVGVDAAAVETAIASFRPLRHRLARVAEVRGVAYWNDSKATNVGATRSSLRAFDGSVVLLAGGVSKGCDFTMLAREAARITLVVAYGEAAAAIEAALASSCRVVREPGLREALRRAAAEATPGTQVLLAPACASFDGFRDYVERGECFERWVAELATAGDGDGGVGKGEEEVVKR